jgi:hypothetical protein
MRMGEMLPPALPPLLVCAQAAVTAQQAIAMTLCAIMLLMILSFE